MQTGYFFKRLTGQDAASCDSLLEIERQVEAVRRQPLLFRAYDSAVIAEHGNVFIVSHAHQDLDQAIDRELAAMSRSSV